MRPNKDFVLRWIDDTSALIPDSGYEIIWKPTMMEAIRSVGLRCYQSPFKLPEGATGFYLCPREKDIDLGN